MPHFLVHALLHSLKDCAVTLPFLFAAYLLLEFFEHHSEIKLSQILSNKKIGPLGGALAGCIPQCGMGVITAHLFSSGIVSAGALIAVFISTSDEALPVILSHPDKIQDAIPLLLAKIAAAVLAGYIYNLTFVKVSLKKHHSHSHPHNEHNDCHSCEEIHHLHEHDCSEHCTDNIFFSALKRTALIFVYIYAVSVVFALLIEFVGEDAIASFLSSAYFLQPVIAAIVGLIPSCAVSVVITELYLADAIGFGAVIAGLSTGAGVGLITLFKTNKSKLESLAIVAYILVFSIVFGEILQLLML